MDGRDVLKKLKDNPKTKNIPVVVLTNLDCADFPEIVENGAEECIVKANVDIDNVVRVISKYLR